MYRGVCALRAVLARAHVTAGTDGGGGVQVVPVEAVGQGQSGAGVAIALVHGDHCAGDRGVVIHQLCEFVDIHGSGVQVFVQHGVLYFGKEPGVVVAGEERSIHIKGAGDAVEDGVGEGTDVVFNLVDVAGRESEGGGE